jgi:hypothetical protein
MKEEKIKILNEDKKIIKYIKIILLLTLVIGVYFRLIKKNQILFKYNLIGLIIILIFSLFNNISSYYIIYKNDFPILSKYIFYYLFTCYNLNNLSILRGKLPNDFFSYMVSYPSSFYSFLIIFSTNFHIIFNKILRFNISIKKIILIFSVISVLGIYHTLYNNDKIEIVDLNIDNKLNKELKIIQVLYFKI